uniref:Ebony (inferred by orthology to a D. melanogaster protein) n=1 Tax=Strongyloides venezuelensis TaxID=75913 RepID=A0A0K0EV35_STRVS
MEINEKLKILIKDYLNEFCDDSLFISIPSIIFDNCDGIFNIKNYDFECVDVVVLENSSDRYINHVEYEEIWEWERILEELTSKFDITFNGKCEIKVSIQIPYLLLYNSDIKLHYQKGKSEIFFDNNSIAFAYIMLEKIDKERRKVSDVEMIMNTFIHENSMGYSKKDKNYDKSFIEYGLDSLQLSLLEYKLQEHFKDGINFEPMFLVRNNTPNKVLQYIMKHQIVKEKTIDKIIPTWIQERFLFIKKYDSKSFENMCEGVKIEIRSDGNLIKLMEKRINNILSHINILRTTINDHYNMIRLSRTETDNQIPLKIKVSKKDTLIILTILFHHIVGDGKSFLLLFDYLKSNEWNFFEKNSYEDYQVRENQYHKSKQFEIDKEFFKELVNDVEETELTDRTSKKIDIGFLNFRIPNKLSNILKNISLRHGISTFSIFLTIYKIAYYKIRGNSNIVIGIPCDIRQDYKFYNTIGPFINIIPFISKIDPTLDILEILKRNSTVLQECISHKLFPYDEIKLLLKDREKHLFDVMFIQEPFKASRNNLKIWKLKSKYLECKEVWTFTQESLPTFNVNVKFNKNIINEWEMKVWIDIFLSIIKEMGNFLEIPIVNLNVYKKLNIEERITKKDYLKTPDIHNIIEKQLNLKNFKIIEEKNDSIYCVKDLLEECLRFSQKINQYYFYNYGEINLPDTPIILYFERNIDLVKVVLALSFSCYASFPINIESSINQYGENEKFLYINEEIINKIDKIKVKKEKVRRNRRMITDIFYLTSTSGSTGKPKIVCSELVGLLNLITTYTRKFFVSEDSIIYQVVNHSFDIFFIDIFQALFNGSNIILAKSKIPDLDNFLRYKISHAYIMPAYLQRLDDNKIKLLSNLKVLLYGGESLKDETLKSIYNSLNEFKIFQEFGLTEHSIYTNIKQMRLGSNPKDIGFSIQNTGCGVIDIDKKFLLPSQSGGKNFVTFGEGVSRGYINNDETKNSFTYLNPNIKCLLTGDIVSFDKYNQTFTFHGRCDSFIKINGNQINIPGVEEYLYKLFPIKDVCVTFHNNEITKNSFLVAHHTGDNEIYNFKDILSKHIPIHWIPEYFIHYKQLPLNFNGKIDRNLLSQKDPLVIRNKKELCPSSVYIDNSEEILCILNYYLPESNINVNDNIFDKGANSIILMMIVQDLENKHGIKINLRDFFRYKSILQLKKNNCISVTDKRENKLSNNNKNVPKDVPLTYGQKFMWLANEFSRINDEYTIEWELLFTKELSLSIIKYVIQSLMKFNITLRSIFVNEKFRLTQEALSMTECFLNYQYNTEEIKISFNLSKDIPFKVNVISNKKFRISFHHICIDGFSFTIIRDQMINLFNNNMKKHKEVVCYFDYAIDYDKKWKKYMEGIKSIKNLTYHKKPAQVFETVINVNFKNISAKNHFSFILYAFGLSLKEHSNNEFIINIPIMKRPIKYIKTVGYFVETFPFILNIKDDDYKNNLLIVRDQLSEILANEVPQYQIEMNKILDKQMTQQKYSFMVILDNFNLNNIIQINNELSVEIVEKKNSIGKFDQTWRLKIVNDKLGLQIEYNKNYFSLEAIKRYVRRFEISLKMLIRKDLRSEILKLIQECLQIDNDIDVTKSFFELGGNSISGALLCSTIRNDLQIPCKINMLFENPIIQDFIMYLREQSKIPDEKVTRGEIIVNYNKIKLNPFVIPIIKFMEKSIRRPKINRKYNNCINIKLKDYNRKLLTNNLNFLLKIQPNLRSISYFKDGIYYCRFLSLTESFLYIDKANKNDDSFYRYSYDDLFVKPWIYASIDEVKKILYLNIGHTIIDGSSMKVLEEMIMPEIRKIHENVDIGERSKIISNFKAVYNENLIDNTLKTYLDDCMNVLDYQGYKFHGLKNSSSTMIYILDLTKYSSMITTLSSKNNATPFLYLITIISKSLSKVLNLNSICFNVPFDIRQKHPLLNNIIGMYVNVMPFLIESTNDDSILESSKKTMKKLLEYCDIHTYSYLNRDISIMIINEDIKTIQKNIPNTNQKFSKNNLSIFITTGSEIKISIYRKKGFIENFIFNNFLTTITQEIIKDFLFYCKGHDKRPETSMTISTLLLRQASLTPSKICIKNGKINFTYNDMINIIRKRSITIKEDYFKEIGEMIVPETIISVEVSREINDIFNILGILYSGASYNPIDNDLPFLRKERYLKQCNGLFMIRKDSYKLETTSSNKYFERCLRSNMAYVIYTSGTTGEPKGICINEDSVINMITQSTKNFFLSNHSIVYQFTKLSFDNSVLEIFGSLCNGGIVYQSQFQYFDSSNFKNEIVKENITHAMLFPGLVSSFNDEEKQQMSLLKYWIVGAEKLPSKLFNEMIKNDVFTVQNYGPTETTGYCIFRVMRKNDNPQNIGKPIKNMNIFVLKDENTYGQLLVSGIGVTRGFLNKNDKKNSFNGTWYKTGDCVEINKLGNVIFIGRNDNQIKIRGFRIELSDIESTIDQLDGVKCSRVLFDDGKLYAVYVSSDKNKKICEELVRKHCTRNLPPYGVPNQIKEVNDIFLTKNMKLDKDKTLRLFSNKSKYENPGDKALDILLDIWKRHLNNPTITIKDKFFEIGGNSINSMQIVHDVNGIFDPEIYVTDIYRYETIEEITNRKGIKVKKINKQLSFSNQNSLPFNFNPNNIQLSFQQYQMYLLNQTFQYRHTNILFVEEININFYKNYHIQNAFMKLLANNIMLRTIFIEDTQTLNIVQRALSLTECFFFFQIQSFSNSSQVKEDIQKNYDIRFNLSSEVSIKPRVYLLNSKCVVVLLMNHIITDAWTTKIIHSKMNQYLSMEDEKLWQFRGEEKDIYSYVTYSYNQSLKHNIFNKLSDEYFKYLTNNQFYGDFFDVNIKQRILTPTNLQQQTKCYTKKYLFTEEESFKLMTLASYYQVSPFVIFLSIFSYHTFLSRDIYTQSSIYQQHSKLLERDEIKNKQTLAILFPFFNRPLAGGNNNPNILSQTIGLFLNNLFLNINLDEYQKLAIKDIIEIIRQSIDVSLKYKEVPWPFLKGKLRSNGMKCYLHDIYFNCRYDMESSDGGGKNHLIEELEEINNNNILDPIQINIDKNNNCFILEYKIHPYILSEGEVLNVYQNFNDTIKNIMKGVISNEKRDDNKNIVYDIIKEVLSLPMTFKLQDDDNFYEIGGNSLSFIRLSYFLREKLKVNINMDDFLSCESIKDIISLTKRKNKKDTETIRVILFPGLFGSTHPYRYLINHLRIMFKNLEIIPITYPRYMENFQDFKSFIEYLKISFQERYCPLQDVPTLLIGTSFGGIVAYEFFLSAPYIQNGFVINIDGIADNRCNKSVTYEEHKKLIIGYMESCNKLSYLMDKNNLNTTDVIEHSWNLLQIVVNYLPRKNFSTHITLITSIFNENPYLWWNLFTNVNLHHLNSTHKEMLNNDNSKEIAEYIKKNLLEG